MTRTHRFWHLAVWITIAPLLFAGILSAILLRPELPVERGLDEPGLDEIGPVELDIPETSSWEPMP